MHNIYNIFKEKSEKQQIKSMHSDIYYCIAFSYILLFAPKISISLHISNICQILLDK